MGGALATAARRGRNTMYQTVNRIEAVRYQYHETAAAYVATMVAKLMGAVLVMILRLSLVVLFVVIGCA
jgi:hypothetical protein